MALQVQYTDQFGNTNPSAYVMVTQFIADNPVGMAAAKRVFIQVCIYVNKKSRDDYKAILWGPQVYVVEEPDPANPIVSINSPSYGQCYTYLKTLPDFAGAIDV